MRARAYARACVRACACVCVGYTKTNAKEISPAVDLFRRRRFVRCGRRRHSLLSSREVHGSQPAQRRERLIAQSHAGHMLLLLLLRLLLLLLLLLMLLMLLMLKAVSHLRTVR